MKQFVTKMVSFAVAIALSLTACDKKDDVVLPGEGGKPGGDKTSIALQLEGSLNLDINSVEAIIDLQDNAGRLIAKGQKLGLLMKEGKLQTSNFELAPGTYKLTRLVVQSRDGQPKAAAAMTGSEKAAITAIDLPVNLAIEKAPVVAAAEVTPITGQDLPFSFGYDRDGFQVQQAEVFIKGAIKVGDVLYDNIPGELRLIGFDSKGNVVEDQRIQLVPGANKISLTLAYSKYQLVYSQWNVRDEEVLESGKFKSGDTIVLGGEKAMKRLKLMEDFTEIMGTYKPNARTVYTYQANGKLSQTTYFQKKPQSEELQLTFIRKGFYQDGKLDHVDLLDANNVKVGYTNYFYDANGKLSNMMNKTYDTEITAAVDYSVSSEGQVIDISYLFDNGNTMAYQMTFSNGNKIADRAQSSTGSTEGGTYSYDNSINPFHNVLFEDIYLSNASRNNKVDMNKGYGGNIPSAVEYKTEYTYDADGYPVTLIRYYKSPATGQFLYKTKTVFTY
ncbi:hypothetical protein KJS94_00710 [Flavihumibacter rivuli]|uniref:hypothetical protein n=1 Tax=Flavihumibacter rivuli TaxID=2838156 RepID=UPI001BDEDCC5|nr:hypothetical protein [Flavihumibacter rivuli]ULQ56714.1 hypothetical protein KJS94_00710 [Flavihumibacter rivuli]